jgi:hypothetical protein
VLEVWRVSVFHRTLTSPTKRENPEGIRTVVQYRKIKKSVVLTTEILHLDDDGGQETIKLASEY